MVRFRPPSTAADGEIIPAHPSARIASAIDRQSSNDVEVFAVRSANVTPHLA